MIGGWILRLTLLTAFGALLAACSSYPEAKFPDLTVVLFNGRGERVEVECNGKVIMNLRKVQPDDNNVASVEKIRREGDRVKFVVRRNGLVAGEFSINPRRIGTVYLFLCTDGSVLLDDGDRLPPIV